jgi:uncharacterized protein
VKNLPNHGLVNALESLNEPTRRRVAKQLGASLLASLGLGGCGGSDDAVANQDDSSPVTPQTPLPATKPPSRSGPDFGATVRVLCVDGGGVRGVIPATILTKLEADLGKPCYQVFDVMGGTSTGGLISAGLSCARPAGVRFDPPYTAQQISDFYQSPSDLGQIFFPNDSGAFAGATYSARSIELWLQTKYPNYSLADAQLAISNLPGNTLDFMYTTSYCVSADRDDQIGMYLFDWDAASRKPEDNYAVWEAVRATSAAPTYFPLAQVGAGGATPRSQAAARWCCDGGVVANDPILLSFYFALQKMTTYAQRATPVKKIQIISIGTGNATENLNVLNKGDWGPVNWLFTANDKLGRVVRAPLINVLMAANDSSTTSIMNTLVTLSKFSGPEIEYHRLQPSLSGDLLPMDKILNASALQDRALSYIGLEGQTAYNSVIAALRR